jgi:hypothetical protein
MSTMTQPVATVIAALLSGLLVAIVTYFINRRKAEAETERTRAETEKLRAETEKLRSELRTLSETVATNLPRREQILLDGRDHLDSFDVRGQGGSLYKRIDGEDRAVTPRGEGTLTIEQGGILNIQRSNTDGRLSYGYSGSSTEGGNTPFCQRPNSLLEGARSVSYVRRRRSEANTAFALYFAHRPVRVFQMRSSALHVMNGCLSRLPFTQIRRRILRLGSMTKMFQPHPAVYKFASC